MPTFPFISGCGSRKFGETFGLFLTLSAIVMGFVVGVPVHVEAGSELKNAEKLTLDSQSLAEHSTHLDQQLADVATRIETIQNQQGSDVSGAHPQSIQQVPQQVATQIQADEIHESEVQQLDETVVKDTYLDPFNDEVNTEVIKDPWEPMNEQVFSFNLNVDRYVLKPVATGYAWLVPDPVEHAIGRALMNIRFVPRTVNNLLQWKMENAGIEVGRFLINSTIGVAGFFDVAGDYFDLSPVPAEDFGQTLAMHGVQAGPYLVLPLLPPTTVRDGIGIVGDLFLDPLSYVLPFVPQASMRATEMVNERSKNLDLYEGVEVATLDMYGAVREAYSQKRSKAIRE